MDHDSSIYRDRQVLATLGVLFAVSGLATLAFIFFGATGTAGPLPLVTGVLGTMLILRAAGYAGRAATRRR